MATIRTRCATSLSQGGVGRLGLATVEQGQGLKALRQEVYRRSDKDSCRRLQEAYASGSLKLVKHIHALLALAQGQSVREVADMHGAR